MASIQQTIAKIRSFQSLPKGWYYGEGDAIGYDMREKAIDFTCDAEKYGIERADAFPGADGEIALSFYVGEKTLAIRIETDDTFSVIEDFKNKIISDSYEINEGEAKSKLWEFSPAKRITSALSTFGIGNRSATDSHLLRLIALQQRMIQKEAFPSSRQSASQIRISLYASISDTTIRVVS